MGGLAALFGNSEEKPQDSEKLMDLYWNRAELKKSFAKQKQKQYKLQDQIKREEGKTARLQQKLDHLEDLLLDPQWVLNIVVYYQLRNLALASEKNLANFAEQLKQQREQRQHKEQLAKWKLEQEEDSAGIQESLVQHRVEIQRIEDRLAEAQQTLESMGFLAKIFKAGAVKGVIRQLEGELAAAHAEEKAMHAELAAVGERAEPEMQGLDIASKRSINLMILAFAQELYLTFKDQQFATLVKEASQKSAGSVNYGSKQDCLKLLDRIQDQLEMMQQQKDFADVLRKRSTMIGHRAEFRHKTDVVPVPASTDIIADSGDGESSGEKKVAILGENWWGIAKVLSR
ncbi:MAG: hypothetical protein R3192_03760 [Woeseiaceae bacterium]|nr:hypothetical protein [Woeseiaceae bacterium]